MEVTFHPADRSGGTQFTLSIWDQFGVLCSKMGHSTWDSLSGTCLLETAVFYFWLQGVRIDPYSHEANVCDTGLGSAGGAPGTDIGETKLES